MAVNAENLPISGEDREDILAILETAKIQLTGPKLDAWLFRYVGERLTNIVNNGVESALSIAVGTQLAKLQPLIDEVLRLAQQ